ncbi:hypothetical protein G7Z17_g3412 [Cylindrodendrum hubeiense]|uniref:Fork-head domain-containing protein n=1 Tax=Cylindrodendrum hubeiense TaxID=595255 RepID=A0A9P5HES1_9HYPO|nr:hypothetical protein G7Z17_g3412 [Cylindrodendrum hubeiense]
MDPPFSQGEQPSRYTSGLAPGAGQQSCCVSELASMDAYYTPSPAAQHQSPHLSETGSLPPTSALYEAHQYPRSTHSPGGYTSMTSNPQYFPRNHHQSWPSPPPGPEEFDEYPYNGSPTCGSSDTGYNPSPVSPSSWPSPHHPFQPPLDQFAPQHQQDSFQNIQICTPTSTDSFPVRGPHVPTPYTGSFRGCLDGDVDGLPRVNSPGTTQDFSAAALSCTSSPGELPAGNSIYMPATNQDDAPLGRPQSLASPDGNRAAEEVSEPAAGCKGDEPYAKLIYRAFKSRPDHAMTLQEIYSWFRDNTDRTKCQGKGWQNSIRHNLSMNAAFTKREPKKASQAPIVVGELASLPASHDSKRSTEWVLADWAIKDGVQSTTRYRKGNSTRSRGNGKAGRSSQHGFQETGNQISTKAVSGRKGGCAASRAKMRSRQTGDQTLMPSTAAAAPAQLPLPIGPPMRPAMLPAMYQYGGDDMLHPPLDATPQMVIKQEPVYSPLTPETTAPDSFPLMLPEPSQAHHGVSANPGAAYALASGSQGPMYTAPSPCEFPFGFNDISGMYQGDYSPVNGQHVVGGTNGGLFGPVNGDTSYGWSNDAP